MVSIQIAGAVLSRPSVQADGMVGILLRNIRVVISGATQLRGDVSSLDDVVALQPGASLLVHGQLIAPAVVLAESIDASVREQRTIPFPSPGDHYRRR